MGQSMQITIYKGDAFSIKKQFKATFQIDVKMSQHWRLLAHFCAQLIGFALQKI